MLYVISGFFVHLSIPKRKEIIKLKIGAWRLEKILGILYTNVHIFHFNNNILFFIKNFWCIDSMNYFIIGKGYLIKMFYLIWPIYYSLQFILFNINKFTSILYIYANISMNTIFLFIQKHLYYYIKALLIRSKLIWLQNLFVAPCEVCVFLFMAHVVCSRSWEGGLSDRYQGIWTRSCPWAGHDRGPIASGSPLASPVLVLTL